MKFTWAGLCISISLLFPIWAAPWVAAQAADHPIVLWHDQSRKLSQWLLQENPDVQPIAFVEPEVALYERLPEEPWPDVILVASNLIALREEFRFSSVDPALLSDVTPELRKTVRASDGHYYGVPIAAGDLIVLFSKKDQKTDLNQTPSGELVIPYFPYFFIPFLNAFDAIQETKQGIELDSTGVLKALNVFRSLYIPKNSPVGCDKDCALQSFINGKANAAFLGLLSLPDVRTKINNVTIQDLPTLGGKALHPWLASYSLVFPNQSLRGKNSEKLRNLIRSTLSLKAQTKLYPELSRLPVTTAALAALQKTSPNTPDLETVFQALHNAIPMPNSVDMLSLWPALSKATESLGDPDVKVEEITQMILRLYKDYKLRYHQHLLEAPHEK